MTQMSMSERKRKSKAVIVGGSIAGLSCAHALIAAGWDVVVLEKTVTPIKGSPTGAGLALDALSLKLLRSWLKQPDLLDLTITPLTIQHELGTERNKNVTWTLTKDENINFSAAHWADIHRHLFDSLPNDIVLWGHLFVSFCISDDKRGVKVRARVLTSGDTIDIAGDLLVAADGSHSSTRKCFFPDLKLRYSGYSAWRGVVDYSNTEHSETILGLRKRFPDLGTCCYYVLGSGTHIAFYELPNKRINWVWVVNQTKPDFEGNSLTMKVSRNMIEKMYDEAERVLVPEVLKLMRETKEPFLNAICDSEPIKQYVWDNVVLVGDAAHPTTPHGARSTNMSILDAAVLGKCLEKWGVENLNSALKEYQSIRLPIVSEQVLFSRRMGLMRQGLPFDEGEPPLDPITATPEDCQKLQFRNMPFFCDIPSILL